MHNAKCNELFVSISFRQLSAYNTTGTYDTIVAYVIKGVQLELSNLYSRMIKVNV